MIAIFKAARGKSSGSDDATQSTSAAAGFGTAGVLLKAQAGRVYKSEIVNKSATPYFVMFFDKATAPINGDTPVIRRRLPLSGEVVIDFTEFGWTFANGIGLAISSTDGTLTLPAVADAHHQTQLK